MPKRNIVLSSFQRLCDSIDAAKNPQKCLWKIPIVSPIKILPKSLTELICVMLEYFHLFSQNLKFIGDNYALDTASSVDYSSQL